MKATILFAITCFVSYNLSGEIYDLLDPSYEASNCADKSNKAAFERA